MSRARKSEWGWANSLWASVGLLFPLGRPDARILDGQGGGDDLDLLQAVVVAGLDDDPRDAGIDRQAGHDPAVGGKMVPVAIAPSSCSRL